MPNQLYIRALERAAELTGGESKLARQLGVRVDELRKWQSGGVPVPGDVFVKVADILADHSISQIGRSDAQQ